MRQIGGGLVLPVRTVGSGLQLVTVNDFTIGLDNGAVAATVRFPADALPGQVFAVTRRTRISQGVVTIDDASGRQFNGTGGILTASYTLPTATGSRWAIFQLNAEGTAWESLSLR